MVKRLVLASPRGYCAGVERAVETVEQALELHGAPVYVREQIVHNAHVVRDLESRGAVFVDSVAEVPPDGLLVFSAHGVSPAVRHSARFRGLRTIDATCPLVSKVHAEARHFARLGYTIFLIGHAGHEEVEGTTGEAPQSIVLVEMPTRRRAVAPPQTERIVYLTQTTLSVDETDEIVAVLRRRFPHRSAEEGRHLLRDDQPAAGGEADLSAVDLLLVIGSRNSSNSNRLVDVARAGGIQAHFIDDESEIDEAWLEGWRGRSHLGRLSARGPRPSRRRLVPRARRPADRGPRRRRRGRVLQVPARGPRGTQSPGRSGDAPDPLAGAGEENDGVTVGEEERRDEPALLGEAEPAAEAPGWHRESGQQLALTPELIPASAGFFAGKR